MIFKRNEAGWNDISIEKYKNEPGTWMNVVRQNLMPHANTGFEVRYFELAPLGYTSFEKHQHEHCVIVLEGEGEVYLDGKWHELKEGDAVHVPESSPHQFRNNSPSSFGILCIVDKDRDRPELLGEMP